MLPLAPPSAAPPPTPPTPQPAIPPVAEASGAAGPELNGGQGRAAAGETPWPRARGPGQTRAEDKAAAQNADRSATDDRSEPPAATGHANTRETRQANPNAGPNAEADAAPGGAPHPASLAQSQAAPAITGAGPVPGASIVAAAPWGDAAEGDAPPSADASQASLDALAPALPPAPAMDAPQGPAAPTPAASGAALPPLTEVIKAEIAQDGAALNRDPVGGLIPFSGAPLDTERVGDQDRGDAAGPASQPLPATKPETLIVRQAPQPLTPTAQFEVSIAALRGDEAGSDGARPALDLRR